MISRQLIDFLFRYRLSTEAFSFPAVVPHGEGMVKIMNGSFRDMDFGVSEINDALFPSTARIQISSENGYCSAYIYGGVTSGYKIEFDEILESLKEDEFIKLAQCAKEVAIYIAAKRRLVELSAGANDTLYISTLQDVIDLYGADAKALTLSPIAKNNTEDEWLLSTYDLITGGRREGSGFVYCLSDQQGHYKLGYSKNVDNRIKQLGTQPPFELKLMVSHPVYDMRRYEAALHAVYNKKRLKGEWFALSHQDLREVIEGTWIRHYFEIQGGVR